MVVVSHELYICSLFYVYSDLECTSIHMEISHVEGCQTSSYFDIDIIH